MQTRRYIYPAIINLMCVHWSVSAIDPQHETQRNKRSAQGIIWSCWMWHEVMTWHEMSSDVWHHVWHQLTHKACIKQCRMAPLCFVWCRNRTKEYRALCFQDMGLIILFPGDPTSVSCNVTIFVNTKLLWWCLAWRSLERKEYKW